MAQAKRSASGHEAKKHYKPDGQLRQSQLVTTFGPGAMVDLVDRAVVIGGLEHWSYGKKGYVALDDARLRAALVKRLKMLDPDLDLATTGYFRMPPEGDQEPYPSVGVRALEFPRWFVCKKCRRLARAADGFETKGNRYIHECSKNQRSTAVPVRFVSACKRGHLSDFAWIPFAHLGRDEGTCASPTLYLEEHSLGDIGRIIVRCQGCGHSNPMNKAAGPQFACNGDRPWLGGRAASEKCDQQAELLVRTASHAYFTQVESALRLPERAPDPVRLRVQQKDVWKAVQKVTSETQLTMLMELQEYIGSALQGFAPSAVLAAIEAERNSSVSAAARPLRTAEYERLIDAPIEPPGVVVEPDTMFAAYTIPPDRADLPAGIQRLVVVPELRDVRVQVSFSRFDSISANLQGEHDFDKRSIKPAVLTMPTGNEKWLPAAEVRGEGVFIELALEAVQEWEKRPAVVARAEKLLTAVEKEGKGEFLGIRFYLLHSLSHLLLTAISLECGYAASAIRERLFCGKAIDDGPDMAGIMLTTGTTGSEGTLGGLVEEGRRIRHHLREAWDLGRLCSNDPVCAAHDPSSHSSDRRTEGAACHGCLYIAENSCERFNRFLDRALAVPTIGNDPDLAFFRERP